MLKLKVETAFYELELESRLAVITDFSSLPLRS